MQAAVSETSVSDRATVERQLTLDELLEISPIRDKETLTGHIKAGRLHAYDWSMCGKGPYGVTLSQWNTFLNEHLLVEPKAADLEPAPELPASDKSASREVTTRSHAERREARSRSHESNQQALADLRASHRI